MPLYTKPHKMAKLHECVDRANPNTNEQTVCKRYVEAVYAPRLLQLQCTAVYKRTTPCPTHQDQRTPTKKPGFDVMHAGTTLIFLSSKRVYSYLRRLTTLGSKHTPCPYPVFGKSYTDTSHYLSFANLAFHHQNLIYFRSSRTLLAQTCKAEFQLPNFQNFQSLELLLNCFQSKN